MCRYFPRIGYRFSLAGLLAFVTIAAIAAAWYGNERRAQERQEAAILEIAKRGGKVVVYKQGATIVFAKIALLLCPSHNPDVRSIGPSNMDPAHRFADKDLRLLREIRNLRSIAFQDSNVTLPAALAYQRENPHCHVSHPALKE